MYFKSRPYTKKPWWLPLIPGTLFFILLSISTPEFVLRGALQSFGEQTDGVILLADTGDGSKHPSRIYVQFKTGEQYWHSIMPSSAKKIRSNPGKLSNTAHAPANTNIWKLEPPIPVHIYYYKPNPALFVLDEYISITFNTILFASLSLLSFGIALRQFLYGESSYHENYEYLAQKEREANAAFLELKDK